MKEKNKIVFYVAESLYTGSGTQEWLERAVHALEKKSEITIIHGTISDHRRWTERDVADRFPSSISIVEVPYFSFFGIVFFPHILYWKSIIRSFRSARLVYMRYSVRLADPIAQFSALLFSKNVIFGFHGYFQYPFWKRIYFWLTAPIILYWASGCHTINTATGPELLSRGARRIFLIPNFVLDSFLPKKNEASYTGDLIFVGRNEYQKGVDLLAGALKKIQPGHPKIKVNFFGTGKQRPIIARLQKRFPNNIFDHGYERDKRKIFSNRKFLLLTSREEPFGLAVIEAMSYGVPVIATKTKGPMDILENGKDGILVADTTQESIAKAIEYAEGLSNSAWLEMSRHAYNKSRMRYTQRQFEEKFEQMLESLQA
ncbi:MAG: hypothetical protein A2722_02755 [Candidatus Doudnabacteria bacterium RIFCSPHIGHO2_01_FULL_50_11]|uniref:Glycosyl transferase family 1 domain-containing protein n=1 Tax=Candidatus Doudnabacteria bacterium RIFCSPHIGHO2_01_FULL_50_11 TaxID=1817828 RepID=A0A1F5PKP2_9BACT|nr:MAG: hypothetical protein A2722_02755 [Candidatus Doudnabacteria bacterium RIFCSPHIGHO2_01_FULL_50_11]HLC44696.1 glycosyltransferase family 4 protein [Patescibacteria group bacterium]